VILRHLGRHVAAEQVTDDWPLGATGAGLDSISLVELLLDCESQFGVAILDALATGAPITLAAIRNAVEDSAPDTRPLPP
jgi:acyl carrier protein